MARSSSLLPAVTLLLVLLTESIATASMGTRTATVTPWQADAWDQAIMRSGVKYDLNVSQPRYLVGLNYTFDLPSNITIQASNNCIGLVAFNGTLFMGFRSGPFHFASSLVQMFIVSSQDGGLHWTLEHTISMGTDVREPHFLIIENGTGLVFSFFQAGTDPLSFDPNAMFRSYYNGPGAWTTPEVWGQAHEIPWQLAWTSAHGGRLFATSYEGDHYNLTSKPDVRVFFNYSDDGREWFPTNTTNGYVYRGGVSEVGWHFDLSGNMWAVMRNEDGDDSGWGSRIAFARPDALGDWRLFPSNASDEYIYESPRMFRHGDDLFLVARRDPNGPYWNHSWDTLPWVVEHDLILAEYSLHSHRSSVWRVNTTLAPGVEPHLEWVTDIPGCGDTAFPSIVRIDEHTYLIVNYTSPTDLCADWPWLEGQIAPQGTSIYVIVISFAPAAAVAGAVA